MRIDDWIKNKKEKILITDNPHRENCLIEKIAIALPDFGTRYMTLYDLLREVYLIKSGDAKDFIDDDLSIKILKDIMNEEFLKFKRELQNPAMYSEILSTLKTLRLSSYEGEETPQTSATIDIKRIYIAYDKALKSLNKFDLKRLIEIFSPEDLPDNFLYGIFCDAKTSFREREFIKNINGLSVFETYIAEIPEKGVFSNDKRYYAIAPETPEISFKVYESKEEEVRGIVEEIIDRKISPMEVEIRYFDNSYDTILEGMASAYNIGIKINSPRSPRKSPLRRMLEIFKHLALNNFRKRDFIKLLSLSIFKINEDYSIIDWILKLESLDFTGDKLNYKADNDFERIFINTLFSLIMDLEEEIDLNFYALKLIDFLSKYTELSEISDLKKFAYNYENQRVLSFKEVLRETDNFLSTLPALEVPYSYPYIVADNINEIAINRPYVYVLGMTSEDESKRKEESPILDDYELSLFSKEILGSTDENILRDYYTDKVFNSAYGELNLSYPLHSLEEDLTFSPAIRWEKLKNKEAIRINFLKEHDRIKEEVMEFTHVSNEESLKIKEFFKNFKFSATTLEELLNCPRCFYFKRVLKIPIAEEREYNFLSPLNKGNLTHKVLETAVKEMPGCNQKEWLASLIDSEIKKYLEIIPPLADYLAEREAKEIKKSLINYAENFLIPRYEEFKNWRVEVFKEGVINTGDYDLNFLARIDRIEYGDAVRIVDYKSGKSDRLKQKSAKGLLIQDALYAQILKSTGEKREIFTSYHFPFDDENPVWDREEANIGSVLKKINSYIKLIEQYGFFSIEMLINPPKGFENLKIDTQDVIFSHKYLNSGKICGGIYENSR